MQTKFIYGTVRPEGVVYIPSSFLKENNLPIEDKVNFTESDDGLSFTMVIGKGIHKMKSGLFRVGPGKGASVVRKVMQNKGPNYPYQYKGVYLLTYLGENVIRGSLVTDRVISIHI